MKNKIVIILTICFGINLLQAQIFQDNFKNDTIGNFPVNWKSVKGYAQVTAIPSGENVLQFTEGINYIKPIVDGLTNNYLDNVFTLEFDAFFDSSKVLTDQYYAIRLWDGHEYLNNGIRMQPIIIKRNGVRTAYFNPEKNTIQRYTDKLDENNKYNEVSKLFEPDWHSIKLEYNLYNIKRAYHLIGSFLLFIMESRVEFC